MTLSEELQWRGFVQQSTYKDLRDLDAEPGIFYHGFDASADSQTVGNLAAVMLDMVFIRHGWRAIILAGGATSLIGDPGGKDKERPLQDEATIAHNVANAQEQFKRVLRDKPFKLVNNLDWTQNLKVIEFLRDIGKHFSMTPLVQRDYIANRIGEGGSGLSYTEFSYTILQGMDYLHLYDHESVTLQLGGSDQWGNCLSGVELVRKARGAEVNALTLPLVINKATGRKFGKSEDGAVWLDSEKTSVNDFYQFWLNADDEGVESYLKIFTELDKTAVDEVMSEFEKNRSARAAQKMLAMEVTTLVHGSEAALKAKLDAEKLFGAQNYTDFTVKDFQTLGLPTFTAEIKQTLTSVLVQAGLAASNTEARRLLQDGGVYINDQQVNPEKQELETGDFINGFLVLRRGKNKQVLIKSS